MIKHKTSTQQIADLVKANRIQKSYTQQQLADLCGISLRSVQRIERAEVLPRDYTLKVLSEHLEITLKLTPIHSLKRPAKLNRSQRIVLSAGLALIIILVASAYVFQSSTFPETTFEATLYIIALTTLYMLLLLLIWR